MRLAPIIACFATAAILLPATAWAESKGIKSLIAVTGIKSTNANDQALSGADKQRALIKEQKSLRAVQKRLDAATTKDSPPAGTIVSGPVVGTKIGKPIGGASTEYYVGKAGELVASDHKQNLQNSQKQLTAMKNNKATFKAKLVTAPCPRISGC